MAEQSIQILTAVPGVGAATIENFRLAGYSTLDELKGIGREELVAIPGVGAATAAAILAFLEKAPEDPVKAYRHAQKRANIPEAGIAAHGRVEERPATRYFYDPHLDPVLRFDPTGEEDSLPQLVAEARRRALTAEEAQLLAEALRNREPWLEWAGKREQAWFDVDPVALHIHERVSTEAIIAAARRRPIQPSLFADPEMEWREAVRFYEHEMDWANRLILGDSLQVMQSLAVRENLAGKVQMIYVDPPYGIKFASNFQPQVTERTVKERESDLTREPEMVKAYRDTWRLGVHSYLAYLKDRLLVARHLLTDSGSIFVQISDENMHRVRLMLDEVFGSENFAGMIAFRRGGFQTSKLLPSTADYILWYAKEIEKIKYSALFVERDATDAFPGQNLLLDKPSGERIRISRDAIQSVEGKVFRHKAAYSASGSPASRFPVGYQGREYLPSSTRGWSTNETGFRRLVTANRLIALGNTLEYVMYFDDFPVSTLSNYWTDTISSGFGDEKRYVVQTATQVIERCMLMTTEPGDLVLDPTAGSGTTAFVAEQWGRRWVTIDTSRVAVAIARQRLLTATYPYYQLADPGNTSQGFVYKTVPHITLGSIARSTPLDHVAAKWDPILDDRLETLNLTLMEYASPEVRTRLQTKLAAKERAEGKSSLTEADRRRWVLPKEKWEHWEVPFDADPDWPEPLQRALNEYRQAWRQKMDEVNETIAASAPQEVLVDRPKVVKGVVRVSGPFTVEGVQPAEETLELETPIGGAPDELDSFDGAAEEPANAEAYLERMMRLLRKQGVRFLDNKVASFERLEPATGELIHAEGEWVSNGDRPHRVAVSFGPQYGPITAAQVEKVLRTAYRRGYDDVVFAGFSFDGAAQAAIQEDEGEGGTVRAHIVHVSPDVTMGDLLKDPAAGQLFTVSGLPRVRLEAVANGEFVVHMEGVDVYDPVANTIHATKGAKVAAWFVDHDYNGRTFNIGQAFFPDRSAWDRLARALKTVVDPERFAAFSGQTSLPFPAGEHRRAAVKVIDPRGNEVMRIVRLDGEVRYE